MELENEIADLRSELATLRAVIHGGTEAVPVGIKSRVSQLADDVAELDTPATRRTLMLLDDDRSVRQLLTLDALTLHSMETEVELLRRADVTAMQRSITRLESNEITDGRSRFATLETTVNGVKRVLWLVATGVAMALIRAIVDLV